MRRRCLALLLLLFAAVMPAAAAEFPIGLVELEGDRDYVGSRAFARFLGQPLGRPAAGAEVALDEVKWHGAAVNAEFVLDRRRAKAGALAETVRAMAADGVRFVLLDLPADAVQAVTEATAGLDLVLFNVAAADDGLRGAACRPHLLHVTPSRAMLSDALGQYLVFRQWHDVLVLEGPSEADRAYAAAFERTAQRYGIEIVAKRPFVLSNDPREREKNNPVLLTTGVDYDVVFVADADGEFARNLAYATARPRPVVGAEGLAALAWHWAWERHGAPQLEKRFEDRHGRPMRGVDWAAWLAVKAVAEAVQRTASTDFATLRDYLRGGELILDGFKGNRLNFRSWDNQLRQPILLATHNHVVARAPLEGFLHRTNNLDTLGHDEAESECRF